MQPNRRSAFTLTELVVSCSLLLAVMGTLAPLTIRCGQLWQESRHQQLAIDELANQLERLTLLDESQRQEAIDELSLPDPLRAVVPDATLAAEFVSDQDGDRVVISLMWNRPGVPSSRPLTMVGWVNARPQQSESAEESE